MKTLTYLLFAGIFSLVTGTASAGDWQSSYSGLIQKYVRGSGVDTKKWHGNSADMTKMAAVVASIADESPSGTKNQRLAWYINAYNALSLHQMLSGGSGRSHIVSGQRMSLHDLEYKLIRSFFKDPRVPYALNGGNSASLRVYNARSLNSDLSAQAEKFGKR